MESAADSTWNGFSLAERDRRWGAVRKNAAEAGFDCIVVPLGNEQDGRYLTEMKDTVIALPTDGRTPIAANDRGRGNSWLPQVRPGERRACGPVLAQALLDLGMERARIGIAGLRAGKVSQVRAPEGVVNHTAYMEIVERLPNATLEDATDIVGFARYVKGEEEIECLRRGAAIAEAGIEEMIKLARPGLDAAVLYGRVTGRLLELGSEHHELALSLQDPDDEDATRYVEPPLGRRLKPGTLIRNEVNAMWGGLVAQEDQPICLGPLPPEWKSLIELQGEVFEAGREAMKPGTTFREFIDFINSICQRPGIKAPILMHGRGYGDDGPLLTPRDRGEHIRDVRFEKGNVWCWKPDGTSADGRLAFRWGGDVLVTETGGERLFQRSHGMVCIT